MFLRLTCEKEKPGVLRTAASQLLRGANPGFLPIPLCKGRPILRRFLRCSRVPLVGLARLRPALGMTNPIRPNPCRFYEEVGRLGNGNQGNLANPATNETRCESGRGAASNRRTAATHEGFLVRRLTYPSILKREQERPGPCFGLAV